MDIVELYLLITFWTSILVSILYCDIDNCFVVDFWVGAIGWLAWCYKVVYIHIGSVYYFLNFWMDIVELYLLITFWTSILVSILYCDIDNCFVVDFWVGAIRWFAWCYEVVSIGIGSVYCFLKIWINIVELYLFYYFISFTCQTYKLNENYQEILTS